MTRLVAVVVLAVAPSAAAQAPDARAARRRALETLGGELEQALQTVGAPAPVFVGAALPRGYHVPGLGAVFALSPRRLLGRTKPAAAEEAAQAMAQATARLERSLRRAQSETVRAELRRALGALRASRTALQAARAVAPLAMPEMPLFAGPETPPDHRQMERHVVLLQRQAEEFRLEAERAWAEAERAVERAVMPAPPAPAAAPAPPAPLPPAPPAAPLPPLVAWPSAEAEVVTPEAEAELLEQVRHAVVPALEGARALRLGPEESVVVVVDFLPRRALWAMSRPLRTVVVRARQKDLEGRREGRFGAEELRRRLDVAAY